LFNESEMALFSECPVKYAPNLLDTADIVRDACLHQLTESDITYIGETIS
jgi:hypothetical protein